MSYPPSLPTNGPFAIISAKDTQPKVTALEPDGGNMRPLITGFEQGILILNNVGPGKYHISLEEGSQKWFSKVDLKGVTMYREVEPDVWFIKLYRDDKFIIQPFGNLYEGYAWTLGSDEPVSPLMLVPLQDPPIDEQLWRIVDLRTIPSFPPYAE